jgi:ATP-dependent helicase/nuclease subunit A
MSVIDDANAAQRAAADPGASVWVAASAGSGKTKVLSDRVLSLLLSGTRPERILCLTFTRAAAAEMAMRVNDRLALWATAPDAAVSDEIAALLGNPPDAARLDRARRLFAQVLDVPGGLKIQTIHGFCQSLLGRFPLEVGIAPHFEAMDERSAAELMAAARDTVLVAARRGGALADALAIVTGHIEETRFAELMTQLKQDRGRIARLIADHGGVEPVADKIYALLEVAPGLSPQDIVNESCLNGTFDAAELAQAAEALKAGTEKTDQPRGSLIGQWLAASVTERQAGFMAYAGGFLTNDGQIRARLITKKAAQNAPGAKAALVVEAERLAAIMEWRRAVITAQASVALLRLGAALLKAYEAAKSALARLDYDDLILKSSALLRGNVSAAWVLYKLDGGLDHILIDEAQDTNPEQWDVVAALADEFFAGEGARPEPRTIFAVGDPKQSIFSFQGADPAAFTAMRDHFRDSAKAAKMPWRAIELNWSFRSTAPVLAAVDAVFGRAVAGDGVVPGSEPMQHSAVREGHAGLVEVWPLVGPRDARERHPWEAPLEREARDSPPARLANVIAARIESWIGREELPSKGRMIRAGDIMILVRRRDSLVERIVRALKARNVPVAGVDRMILSEQLAIMDLIALGDFLLLPEDDLTLASVLKGPFIGLNDDDLFALAYDRGKTSLWRRLAADTRFAAAHAWLAALLARVDYIPPYELFAHVLNAPAVSGSAGRQCLVARLGVEAEDPIEEFMNLTLAHERVGPPSLQGFLHWLRASDDSVKRDMEHRGRDEVRVITVHGAKGLQAPVVILPDCVAMPQKGPEILWTDGLPLWPPKRSLETMRCAETRAEADRHRDQEYRRLLYVAMTRAEDRLYVCGWHGPQTPSETCWYNLVADGIAAIAEPYAFSAEGEDGWTGDGWRLTCPQTAPPAIDVADIAAPDPPPETERWMHAPPPPEPVPSRPLAPSQSGVDPVVVSPLDGDAHNRFQRGQLIHRLLQMLPDLPADRRAAAAGRYLDLAVHDLDADARRAIAAEVMAVMEDPAFAPLFGPDSRAEAPITGIIDGPQGPETVSGQVDRLVVHENKIIVIDYKTNRPPPARQPDVAEAYLRQMAAYRAVLRQIWPDRQVRCVLLWTDGPRTMSLDNTQLDRFFDAS